MSQLMRRAVACVPRIVRRARAVEATGLVKSFAATNSLCNARAKATASVPSQRFYMSAAGASGGGPVEATVRSKLTETFLPAHLEVMNESYMHNVPKGSETHFKVVVVSDAFEGLPLIKRHRAVNAALKDELASGVHALTINAKTPAEWEASGHHVEPSPKCAGGARR